MNILKMRIFNEILFISIKHLDWLRIICVWSANVLRRHHTYHAIHIKIKFNPILSPIFAVEIRTNLLYSFLFFFLDIWIFLRYFQIFDIFSTFCKDFFMDPKNIYQHLSTHRRPKIKSKSTNSS